MSFYHFAVHFALAVACIVFAARGSAVSRLIRVRWWTRVSVATFFLSTAFSEMLVATSHARATGTAIIDTIRLVALVAMMAGAFFDQNLAVRRMANALGALSDRFDGLAVVPGAKGRDMIKSGDATRLDCGHVVADTVSHAMLGSDEA